MAIIVAIEGGDGAGKGTTSARLREELEAEGLRATVLSFPRYGETAAAITLGQFLAGKLPVAVTPASVAVLYALDRFESRDHLAGIAAAHDVVILDRYIASNMAYQAAKVPADEARAMMEWIRDLETGQLGLPAPTFSIYLDTPWELSRDLILRKAQRSYTDRSYDEHEADVALQRRVRDNYAAMVAANLLGPWHIVAASENGAMRDPAAITAEIRGNLLSYKN